MSTIPITARALTRQLASLAGGVNGQMRSWRFKTSDRLMKEDGSGLIRKHDFFDAAFIGDIVDGWRH